MEATGWVALYGAVLSTAGIVSQLRTQRQARRLDVQVELSYLRIGSPDGDYAAHLRVRKRSDFTIRVVAVGFDMQAGTMNKAALHEPPPGATLPGLTPPRDVGFAYILDNSVSPLDLRQPLVGWMELATARKRLTPSRPPEAVAG
jgi:hypothetical protein